MFFSSRSPQGSIKATASGSITSQRTTITTTTAQSISFVSAKHHLLSLSVWKAGGGGQMEERQAL